MGVVVFLDRRTTRWFFPEPIKLVLWWFLRGRPIEDVVKRIPPVHFNGGDLPRIVSRIDCAIRLAARGACRFISIGHTVDYSIGGPFNSYEIMRRSVRWVLDESYPSGFSLPFFYLKRPGRYFHITFCRSFSVMSDLQPFQGARPKIGRS